MSTNDESHVLAKSISKKKTKKTQKVLENRNLKSKSKWFIRYCSTDAGLQQYRATDITAKSHYDDYQLITHNSSDKNN